MSVDKLNLLLADDDTDDWEIFQEGLAKTIPSHTLHWIKYGEQVLPGIKEIQPDILFLDLNIPGTDGMECLRMLKDDQSLQKFSTVIYTTSNAPGHIQACYDLGAARYLLKPVNYTGIFKGLEIIYRLFLEKSLVRGKFENFVIDTYKLQ